MDLMRKRAIVSLGMAVLAATSLTVSAASTLNVYFIDVEGGQAPLTAPPAGQSLLIDAGYGGLGNRDPERIMAAVRDAGITQIDYLLITHSHGDHSGGVPGLSRRIPIRTFID